MSVLPKSSFRLLNSCRRSCRGPISRPLPYFISSSFNLDAFLSRATLHTSVPVLALSRTKKLRIQRKERTAVKTQRERGREREGEGESRRKTGTFNARPSKFKPPPPTSRRKLAKDLIPRRGNRGGRVFVTKDAPRPERRERNPIPSNEQQSRASQKPPQKPLLRSRPVPQSSPVVRSPLSAYLTPAPLVTQGDLNATPTDFGSPPLLPGLLQSVRDVLGEDARPVGVQGLVLGKMQNMFAGPPATGLPKKWEQFLLASETGSGKSIAYMLPALQWAKKSEQVPPNQTTRSKSSPLPLNPRVLILAPTHELVRQLSRTAKSLLHHSKLRVFCASQSNVQNSATSADGYHGSSHAGQMKRGLDLLVASSSSGEAGGEFEVTADYLSLGSDKRDVDVLVATPSKALEMAHGWGWDRVGLEGNEGFYAGPKEMGLGRVECVVIDEADILLDDDFKDHLNALLNDISTARSHILPPTNTDTPSHTHNFPFHLLLSSATIPSSLNSHLSIHYPRMVRLVSQNIHRIPPSVRLERVSWSGGNKCVDVGNRVRRVWAEDALRWASAEQSTGAGSKMKKSKILIFCNKRSRARELAGYLEEQGEMCVLVDGRSAQMKAKLDKMQREDSADGNQAERQLPSVEIRRVGSNAHLGGFLTGTIWTPPKLLSLPSTSLVAPHSRNQLSSASASSQRTSKSHLTPSQSKTAEEPSILITTSLLSRGLDFSSDVRHVFVVDEPRSVVDFLHRAGRVGRAISKPTPLAVLRARAREQATVSSDREASSPSWSYKDSDAKRTGVRDTEVTQGKVVVFVKGKGSSVMDLLYRTSGGRNAPDRRTGRSGFGKTGRTGGKGDTFQRDLRRARKLMNPTI